MELAQRISRFSSQASPADCGPAQLLVLPAKVVSPADIAFLAYVVSLANAVLPAEVFFPAQAGIVGAGPRWWCQDFGFPASRQAAPGGCSHWGGRCCARLPCGARPGVASRNSLRSLRSLRSHTRDENDDEARCARRPLGWPCRPRWASGPAARQAQTVHWTVCVRGSPPRRPRVSPRQAAAGATLRFWCSVFRAPGSGPRTSDARTLQTCPQRRVRPGRSAPLVRREAQGLRPRAQRDSSTDSSRLSERRERSERSEFRDAAARPSIAGQSGAAPTAPVKRCGLGARVFAATKVERHAAPVRNRQPPQAASTAAGIAGAEARQRGAIGSPELMSATGRKRPLAQPAHFTRHRSGITWRGTFHAQKRAVRTGGARARETWRQYC